MSKARKPNRRDEWRREQDACFNPACPASYRRGDVMDTHEILGGPLRSKTVDMPCMFMFLCRRCHDVETSCPSQDRLVKLLAVKQWADPEHYDPTAVIMMWRPNGTPELLDEINADVNAAYAAIVSEYA